MKLLLTIGFIFLSSLAYAGMFNDNGAVVGQETLLGSSKVTKYGEFQVLLYNRTGHASKRGEVVMPSRSFEFSVTTNSLSGKTICGVMGDNGVADGGLAWVTYGGMAQFLVQDSTTSTRGWFIQSSATQLGRVQCIQDEPAQPTFSTNEHDAECGHTLETVTAGTDKLFWGLVHFR